MESDKKAERPIVDGPFILFAAIGVSIIFLVPDDHYKNIGIALATSSYMTFLLNQILSEVKLLFRLPVLIITLLTSLIVAYMFHSLEGVPPLGVGGIGFVYFLIMAYFWWRFFKVLGILPKKNDGQE